MRIDRCLCTGRTFADLAAQAKREGLELDALMALPRENGGCGGTGEGATTRCGLCRPYLRAALQSGETVFHDLLPLDAEELR